MASGGQNPSHRRNQQSHKHPSSSPGKSSWFLPPNNLELTQPAGHKSGKKQRNRDRAREQYTAENALSATSSSSSSARWDPSSHPAELPFLDGRSNPTSRSAHRQQMPGVPRDTDANMANLGNAGRGLDGTCRSAPTNSRQDVQPSLPPARQKQNNTSITPDSSAIVERLMQLRDCIKQVNALKQNLERTDEPKAREHVSKLTNTLRDLQNKETTLEACFLQQLDRENSLPPSSSEDSRMAAATGAAGEPHVGRMTQEEEEVLREKGEVLLKRRNDLLKKVIESREKLASLEQQQAMLLAMQKQAESQLTEARALQEHLLSQKELPQKSNPSSPFTLNRHSGGSDDSHRASDSAYSEDPEWDADHTPSATSKSSVGRLDDGAAQGASSKPSDIMALAAQLSSMQKRIQLLNQLEQGSESAVALTSDEQTQPTRDENLPDLSLPAVDQHRQQLENKLQELHAKKRHMDGILQQLSSLQGNSQPPSEPVSEVPTRRSSTMNQNAQETIRQTHQFLDSIDTREKMRSLEEMRNTIQQLQMFVENYQPPALKTSPPESNLASQEASAIESRVILPPRRKDLPHPSVQQQRSQVLMKQENSEAEVANGFPARRHYEAEGRANEDADAAAQPPPPQGKAWNKNADGQTDSRRLDQAKSKIQKLEAMLGTVRQLQTSGKPISQEFIDAIESSCEDSEDDDSDHTEGAREEQPLQPHQLNNEAMAQDNEEHLHKLKDVEERMLQQQQELQQLLDERLRLLSMRDALQSLQRQINAKNNDARSTGDTSQLHESHAYSLEERPLPRHPSHSVGIETAPKQDNTSNRDTALHSQNLMCSPSRMDSRSVPLSSKAKPSPADHNLSLRQEMQSQMDVLKELLNQEKSKQLNYLRNEDVHSFAGSSSKSELMDGSVLAADTTVAATWGGSSTQENLEEEEEAAETGEEQDENETGSESQGQSHERWGQSETFSALRQSFSTDQQQRQTACKGPALQPKMKMQPPQSSSARDTGFPTNSSGKTWRKPPPTHVKNQGGRDESHFTNEENETANQVPVDPSCITPDPVTRWQQFLQQMNQQLEQACSMFYSALQDPQAWSRLMQNPTGATVPDVIQQCTRQLQQQMLLLHLGQCYQIMHMQQLEISQLQQYLAQPGNKIPAGGTLPPPPPSFFLGAPQQFPQPLADDFGLRHWYGVSGGNPPQTASRSFSNPMMASHVPSSISPMFGAPASNVTMGATNSSEGRGPTETLNNQVPPGTRANNFWDNFRSYSRQNLLSAAANSKSNEHLSSTASQQFNPLTACHVAAASASPSGDTAPQTMSQTRNSRTWEWVYPRGENAQAKDGSRVRPLPNTERQALLTRPKRKNPNSNQEQQNLTSVAVDSGRHHPGGSANLLSSTPEVTSVSSAVPMSSLAPTLGSFDTSSIFSSNPIVPTSNESTAAAPLWNQPSVDLSFNERSRFGEAPGAREEASAAFSQTEKQPPFLYELLRHLQHLKSDVQWENLLSTLQEIISRSSEDASWWTQAPKRPGANRTSVVHGGGGGCEGQQEATPNSQGFTFSQEQVSDPSFAATDAGSTGGAVRKRQCLQNGSSTSTSIFQPQIATESANDQGGGTAVLFSHLEEELRLEPSLERTVMELTPFLQSIRDQEFTPHLQAKLCSQVLGTLRFLPPGISAPLFFRSKLLQALQQALAKYSGKRIYECESEVLLDITKVTLKFLAIQSSSQHDEKPESATVKINNGEASSSMSLGHVDMTGPESDEMNAQMIPHSVEGHFTSSLRDSRPHQSVEASAGALSRSLPKGEGNLVVEDDAGYECDVEGETEPEVEAETEADDTKDLAEADQTPKQIGESESPAADEEERQGGDAESEGGCLYLMNAPDVEPLVATSSASGEIQQESMYQAEGIEQKDMSLDEVPTRLSASAAAQGNAEDVHKDSVDGQTIAHSESTSNEEGTSGFEQDKGTN